MTVIKSFEDLNILEDEDYSIIELKYIDLIEEKNREHEMFHVHDTDEAWYWWQVERFCCH